MAAVVASYDGINISHICSEGDEVLAAVEELISIVRATGVRHVVVNGTQVLRHGEDSGETAGRFVMGSGWDGK